nr:MAG TPA: hypothetical protein [Inoviridae sp.]
MRTNYCAGQSFFRKGRFFPTKKIPKNLIYR